MLKLVVDTNIVVSALLKPDSLPDLIINMILNKSFILCLSEDIFNEYQEVLSRGKFKSLNQAKTRRLLLKIKRDAKLVKPSVSVDIVKRDPEDNKFLECALEAQADYFITGNIKHFSFRKFRNIILSRQKSFLISLPKLFLSLYLKPFALSPFAFNLKSFVTHDKLSGP